MKLRTRITAISLSAVALVSIVMHEGYSDKAYPDSGGISTIGFGSIRHPNGTRVKQGDTITPPKALSLAMQEIMVVEAALKKCISAEMYQYEFDAYLSLGYNVGTGAVCASSIPLKLAMGDYAGACQTILDFDKIRDCSKPKVLNKRTGKYECPLVKLKGLTNRRQKEWRQCQGCMNCHVTIP